MWADLTFPPINLYSAPVMMGYRERLSRTASQLKSDRIARPANEATRQLEELSRLLDMPR